MKETRAHARAWRDWRGVAVSLVTLIAVLAGCAPAAESTETFPPAVRPTLSPFPVLPTNAPLREQLHLRAAASQAHTLLVQPDDGRNPILNALSGARSSIHLQIYLLSDREIIYALQGAVKRGVTVRVLMEEKPCCSQNNAMHRSVFAELQEARVQVQWANPIFRLTHTKMLIVDDAQVFVMTQNLTKSGFQYNREAIIASRDAVDVASTQAVFFADWNRTPLSPTNPNLVVANINARAKLLMLINGATHTLDIESEAMQDAQIGDALIAAQQRGVAVRFIGSMPPPGTGTGSGDASVPGRKRLAAGGVAVRVLATPYLHTKTMVADSAVAYVGSVNFTAASLDENREVGILTENKGIIARLETIFVKDWTAAKSE